jgi:hypothetical protein
MRLIRKLRSVRLGFRDSFGQAVAEAVEAEASAQAETAELLNARRTEQALALSETVEREAEADLLVIEEARRERSV